MENAPRAASLRGHSRQQMRNNRIDRHNPHAQKIPCSRQTRARQHNPQSLPRAASVRRCKEFDAAKTLREPH
jgi:hypothetical protein